MLSRARGSCKTVAARFWPWLSGEKNERLKFSPLRSEGCRQGYLAHKKRPSPRTLKSWGGGSYERGTPVARGGLFSVQSVSRPCRLRYRNKDRYTYICMYKQVIYIYVCVYMYIYTYIIYVYISTPARMRPHPLSSECGTYKAVKARLCPWLAGKSP